MMVNPLLLLKLLFIVPPFLLNYALTLMAFIIGPLFSNVHALFMFKC